MSRDVIESIKRRFPYLSADVSEPRGPTHPQREFELYNRADPTLSAQYAQELDGVARHWARQVAVGEDPEFTRVYDNLLAMLEAVSATSVLLLHGDRLLAERPGVEVDNRRRGEVTAWCRELVEHWSQRDEHERLSMCRLCLMGVSPLHVEVVNYLATEQVPEVLGRMLARLDGLSGKGLYTKGGGYASLCDFHELEQQVLRASNTERTSMPVGTWPRIYVPSEALARDECLYDETLEALNECSDRQEAMVSFLRRIWRDFADEAFFAIHEGDSVTAYALVGGCCFFYRGDLDTTKGKPAIRSTTKPAYLDTAGDYRPLPWRRQSRQLCFEGGDPVLAEFRTNLIRLEAEPTEVRAEAARSGFILRAAERLLSRQINYNISSVLNKRMHRLTIDEWSPNMCRDGNGRIYNIPHAYGGVGDMFRGLLDFGGRSSQFRCWREVDGSYTLADMRPFRAYKHALDSHLQQAQARAATGSSLSYA
jgi:hypothetical protein